MKRTHKTHIEKILLALLLTAILFGCGKRIQYQGRETSQPKHDPSPIPTQTFIPTPTEVSTPTITPTLISTSTLTPVSHVETTATISPESDWSVYIHPSGVEVKYPSEWEVKYVYDQMTNLGNVSLFVYPRLWKDRHIADPHTWSPNEGGMVILWEKPVDVNGIKGIEFLWGHDTALHDRDARGSDLTAILYNPEKGLDVRLMMAPPQSSVENFSPDQFDTSQDSSMIIIEKMLRSIKFGEPTK